MTISDIRQSYKSLTNPINQSGDSNWTSNSIQDLIHPGGVFISSNLACKDIHVKVPVVKDFWGYQLLAIVEKWFWRTPPCLHLLHMRKWSHLVRVKHSQWVLCHRQIHSYASFHALGVFLSNDSSHAKASILSLMMDRHWTFMSEFLRLKFKLFLALNLTAGDA